MSDSGVTAGDTIQLGQDKITTSAKIEIKKNLTVDLNGHTIEGGHNEGVFQAGDDWGSISATLTIEDSVGSGKINYTGTGAAAVGFGFNDSNKFVMNGGSIESNKLIFNEGVTASITINNGEFKATNTDTVKSKLSQDAKFIYLDDVLYVGDSASSVAPTEFSLEIGGVTRYYSDAAKLATAGETYGYAKIGGKYYSSLFYAAAAATDGDTITLLKDTSGAEFTNKNCTLDLNGNNVTGQVAANGANLTIRDSKATSEPTVDANNNVTYEAGKIEVLKSLSPVSITNGGTVILESGKLINNNTDNNDYGVNVGTTDGGSGDNPSSGTFIMKGGYIEGKNSGVAVWYGSTVDIQGGVVKSTDGFALANNGSDTQSSTMTVSGGKLIALDGPAIYHPGTGTLNIDGGEITGTTGVEIRSGELNVTGGTITGTGTEYSSKAEAVGGSTSSGAGIAIAQHTTAKPITVNISGSATEIKGASALALSDPQGNAEKDDDNIGSTAVTIKDGQFESTATGDNANALLLDDANASVTVDNATFTGNVTIGQNAAKAVSKSSSGETIATPTKAKSATLTVNKATVTGDVVVQEGAKAEVGTGTEAKTTTANIALKGGTYSGEIKDNTVTKDQETSTVTTKSISVTGGQYTNNNVNVADLVPEGYEKDANGNIVTKSKWVTTATANQYNYVLATDLEDSTTHTIIATAAGVDDASKLKHDNVNRLLGIPSTASVQLIDGKVVTDSNFALAKYSTATGAITLTPQTEGFKIIDTNFINNTYTTLVASGSYAINVDASGTGLALTNIKGGDGDDTLKAGDRATTLDGGLGNDQITGNTAADTFIYSGGNDVIESYTKDNDTISLASDFKAVTDGNKISGTATSVILTFDDSNSLAVKTPEIAIGNYTYTKDYGVLSKYATLSAGATSPFDMGNIADSVDASAVTTAINIAGNDKANYIIAGNNGGSVFGDSGADTIIAGKNGGTLNGGADNDLLKGNTGTDTFVHTAGSDTIQNYDIANDIVTVSTAPPTDDLTNNIKHSSTEFVINISGNDSLTFNGPAEIKLTNNGDTYYYKEDRVIKNNVGATLGSLFSDKTFNVNKLSSNYVTYSSIATIDASKVTVSGGLNITGNSDNPSSIKGAQSGGNIIGGDGADTLKATGGSTTLNGGAGNDSLVGGTGTDLFVYNGGTDTVSGYGTGTDTVRVLGSEFRLAEATVSVGAASGNVANISLGWGGTDNLIFQNIGADEAVTVQQGTGNNYYTYAQKYSAHNKSITLASGHASLYNGASDLYANYETINAAAVSSSISVVGNENANYIFGPTAANATLNGGKDNDKINVSDRGTSAKYLFEYTAGKDEVIGFDATKDMVDIAITDITAAKASNSNSKLTLTVNKNKDVLTLRSEDEIEKVSLQSGGYLTKDGYVSGQGFSLFGSAKGQIDLNDALYKDSNISLVAADSVKSQGVTLTGGADGGTFIYAANNKRRDGFVYGGGKVSISGYEAGRDRIDLNAASFSGFTVGDDVVLNVGSGTISIAGAKGQEVLLHDQNIGRGYKKMVFTKTGVIENKAKNPTMATVSGAATKYSVPENGKTTIKKIYVTGLSAEGVSIQAGSKNNTQIDASNAGQGVSLSGGAKNDKLIGNTLESANDLFVYSAGKDVIQGYSDGDSISISGGLASSLGSAKITAGSKSIKFQFTSKNSLTIKSNSGETLSNTLNINGNEKTYAKNAIESGGQATLTSAYSGTFNTASTKGIDGAVSTVDGSAVSKNLTYKGSTAAESLVGGTKKTTFKGGGGNDTLVGGSGKDVFFYAKNDAGTSTIADFEFGTNGRAGNDKLKIASGTISEISTVTAGGNNAIQFAMNTGKNSANVGWFQVTSGKDNAAIDAKKVAIKANNTYYWFAPEAVTEEVTVDGGQQTVTLASAGQLVTSNTRVSASDVNGYDIIDLNYSTNLAKSGVAVKVTTKPTAK